MNYSLNNLGSFTARYLFPFFVAFLAYQGNFFISFALMCLNLVMFWMFRKELTAVGNEHDQKPLSFKTRASLLVALLPCLAWCSGFSVISMKVNICSMRWGCAPFFTLLP